MSDKAKMWIGKASFIATGIGFIAAGVYSPEALPGSIDTFFGVVGAALMFLGG